MTQVRPAFSEIVQVVSNYYTGGQDKPYRRVAKLLYELEYDWSPDYTSKCFVQKNKKIVKSLFEAIPSKRHYKG